MVDRRNGRTHPTTTSTAPIKAVDTSALSGLVGATGYNEAGVLSASADQSRRKSLGSLVGGGAVPSSPSSPASSLCGQVHGESLLSLADTPLGGGGGGGAGTTTYVDNFLAGFARACGGDEDDRPRQTPSGGALGAGAALGQHEEEDVAAAAVWRVADTEADAGGSEDRSSRCERGAAAAVPAPGSDPGSSGERPRQHAPLLQGSPLRPGGRAAVVPPTCSPSKLSRLRAAARLVGDGDGNGNGKQILARGTEFQRAASARATEGEGRRGSKAPDGTAVGGAARREGRGYGVVSPAVSEARGNIDRVMSSLLEEVLPARREDEASEKAASGGGGGGERSRTSGEINRCPSPPAAAGSGPSRVVAGIDNASVRRSCLPHRHHPPSAPVTSTSPASVGGRSGYSTPVSDGAADSNNSSSGFLTPVEVLMHAPAGGGHAACPQCGVAPRARSQSLEVEEEAGPSIDDAVSTNGAAAHRHDIDNRAGSRRSRGASAATGQRFGGNVPAGAAAGAAAKTKRRPGRNSKTDNGSDAAIGGLGDGNGSERRSSTPAGEAGVCGTIEVGGAGRAAGCLGELEAEVGAGAALMRRNHAALLRVVREQEDRGKQVRVMRNVQLILRLEVLS